MDIDSPRSTIDSIGSLKWNVTEIIDYDWSIFYGLKFTTSVIKNIVYKIQRVVTSIKIKQSKRF